ncbi:MAG: TAXI family TRAP transporter solute-binding subunit [Marinobacter sp.]
MKRRTFVAGMLATPIVLSLPRMATASTAFIYIGSGSTAGLYYPTAVGIANIINEAGVNIRTYVRTTGASVYNCGAVGSGELQMGLTQNNIAFYAYNGRGVKVFEGKPLKKLRGLTVLYPEVIHILVRKLAGIRSISDLRGKRVYVGDTGSGTEEDVRHVLTAFGLTIADFRAAVRGNSGDAVNLLRDGQIDAMFYTVGLGTSAISGAVESGDVELLDIPADTIRELREEFPFYSALTIPARTYPGIDHDTSVVTLKAMLVGSSELTDDVVYRFMNTIFGEHLDKFRDNARNPNLQKYFKLGTALEGMPIPAHAGAIRFFREQGVDIPHQLLAKSQE